MMKFLVDFSWPIAASIGAYAVYALILKPKMAEAAHALGKSETVAAADGWMSWGWAKVDGWKTTILSAVAGGVHLLQLLPAETITEWQQLPWGSVFESSVANKVSVVCAFLIAITHAAGLAKAAKTMPMAE